MTQILIHSHFLKGTAAGESRGPADHAGPARYLTRRSERGRQRLPEVIGRGRFLRGAGYGRGTRSAGSTRERSGGDQRLSGAPYGHWQGCLKTATSDANTPMSEGWRYLPASRAGSPLNGRWDTMQNSPPIESFFAGAARIILSRQNQHYVLYRRPLEPRNIFCFI